LSEFLVGGVSLLKIVQHAPQCLITLHYLIYQWILSHYFDRGFGNHYRGLIMRRLMCAAVQCCAQPTVGGE
ncbi:MAG: hypothetical protein ACP5VQ_10855, partial [Phycisphaerae bacterium]